MEQSGPCQSLLNALGTAHSEADAESPNRVYLEQALQLAERSESRLHVLDHANVSSALQLMRESAGKLRQANLPSPRERANDTLEWARRVMTTMLFDLEEELRRHGEPACRTGPTSQRDGAPLPAEPGTRILSS